MNTRLDVLYARLHVTHTRNDVGSKGLLVNDAAKTSRNDLACAWDHSGCRIQCRVQCPYSWNVVNLSCTLFLNILFILILYDSISFLFVFLTNTWILIFFECFESEKMRHLLLTNTRVCFLLQRFILVFDCISWRDCLCSRGFIDRLNLLFFSCRLAFFLTLSPLQRFSLCIFDYG